MPARTKWKSRPRDLARMAWIKEQSCCAADPMLPQEYVGPCLGVVEADHAGGGSGMGRKCDDSLCIPLCQRHHRSPGLEHLLFGHVPHGEVRRWKAHQAEQYQRKYDEQHGGGR